MLSKLPPRERQIVDILYERGPVLRRRYLRRPARPAERIRGPCDAQAARGQGLCDTERVRSAVILYSPAVSDTVAKKSALSEIVRVFFNGSPASAASALLGMSDRLKEDELDELEQMIARARKAKGGK